MGDLITKTRYYQFYDKDGKKFDVDAKDYDADSEGFAKAYPDVSMRMVDKDGEQWDIPVANVGKAIKEGGYRLWAWEQSKIAKDNKQPVKAQSQQNNQQPNQSQKKQGPYKPTWQEQWAMGITANQAEDAALNATRPIDNRQRNAEIYNQNAMGTNPELGKMGRVVEDEGSYITQEGSRHNVLVDANERQKRYNDAINLSNMQMRFNELLQEKERLQGEIDNASEHWVDQDGNVHATKGKDGKKYDKLVSEYQRNEHALRELSMNEQFMSFREEQARRSLADISQQEEQLATRREKSDKDKSFIDKLFDFVRQAGRQQLPDHDMMDIERKTLERSGAYGKELQEIANEENLLGHRRDLIQDGIDLMDEIRTEQRGGIGNLGLITAGRNVWNSTTKKSTWDYGISELDRNLAIMQAVVKLDNGQKLSKNEQALLNDWALNNAISAQFSDQLSGWAKAGMVTGESLPFMLEMAINPLSGLGENTTKALTKYAIKRYGTKWVRDHIKSVVIGKMVTRGAADIAGAYGMATTTGIARVASDAVRRSTGQVEIGQDAKGDIIFNGIKLDTKEDPVMAIFHGLNSTAIENWSEMAGNYLGFLSDFFGKVVGKAVIGKTGREMLAATGSVEGVSLNKAQKFIYELAAGKGIGAFSEGLAQFAKKTQWHGVFNEYLEEVMGNILQATPLVGDMTFDTEKDTGVFNLEQNIDTFCGVALMGGFMSALHTAGFVGHKINYNPDLVSNDNTKLFGEEEWGDIKSMIDNSHLDPRELRNTLSYLLRGKTKDKDGKDTKEDLYSNKEKRAILKYTQAVLEKDGRDMTDYQPRMESSKVEETTGNDGKKQWQVTSFDINGRPITQQAFDTKSEADAFEGELKMQQQKQDFDDFLSMSTKLGFSDVNNAIDEFLSSVGITEESDGYEEAIVSLYAPHSELGKQFQAFKNSKVIEKAKASKAAIEAFEEENGWTPGTVKWLSEQDPMHLDAEGLQMQDMARDFLETLAYPSSDVNVEHNAQKGAEAGEAVVANVISTEESIDPNNNAGKEILDQWNAAQANLGAAFDKNEDLEIDFRTGVTANLSPQEILSSLNTYKPEEVQAVIDYFNAKAKYNAFINAAANKIDEEAANSRQRHTFKGTVDGVADLNNVRTITDGTNHYYLVSGNITTDPATGKITGSTSGLIIGMDLDGSFVQINESDGYSLEPVTQSLDQFEEAERIRLQELVTSVIDPENTLNPEGPVIQSGDNAGDEAGTEGGTGADNSPATALSKIPLDDKGQPIYTQASPEDAYDAIVEQVNGNEQIAKTLAQRQLDDAQKRLAKLEKKMEKGEFEGNTLQEQIESSNQLQQAIDAEKENVAFWQNVLNVPVERKKNTPPPPPPTPVVTAKQFIDRMEAAGTHQEVDAIFAEGLNAGIPEEELMPTYTRRHWEIDNQDVPEYRYDTPEAARKRGFKIVEGQRIDRQKEKPMPQGMEVEVQYSTKDKVKGRLTVSELGDVQGSHHINGQVNDKHFIPEAQPKAEFGADRQAAAQSNASEANFRPELMLTFNEVQSAYSGSTSQTNRRGEVIQGNGRRNLAEYIYAPGNEAVAKRYKEFLMAHAAELGTTAEEIEKMEKPFAHIVLDVTDEEAIRLGQFTAADLETGGKKIPEVSTTATKLGDKFSSLANIVLRHEDPDASLADRIEANADDAVRWLNQGGYINNTEAKTLLEDKAAARQFIKDLLTDTLFSGANPALRTMFYELPKNIQSAIVSVIGREVTTNPNTTILKDIQESIQAYHELMVSSPQFAGVKGRNYEERKRAADVAVNDWLRQINLDGTLNKDKFSNFALELAKLYRCLTDQKTLASRLRDYYDLVGGATRQLGMFDEPGATGTTTREEAIKQIFGIEYGRQRTVPLAGDNKSSEEGGEGGPNRPQSGKREEGEGGPSDTGRRDSSDDQEVGEGDNNPPTPPTPPTGGTQELTLEALEASDLDEAIKSGARAWLNGDKSQANQFAFLIAQDYVRNTDGDNQRGSQDADGTQLGGEDNGDRESGATGPEGGTGEQMDSGDDGEGLSELRTGGEDSQGDVASGDGTGGDRGVSGGTPGQDEGSVSNGPGNGSIRGKNGGNGKRRGSGSGSTVSRGNAGGQKSTTAREDFDAALEDFIDALKEDFTKPVQGKLLAVDPISLYAYLGGVKAIKVLTAGAKLSYAAIKLGYYEFKDWYEVMKSKLTEPLTTIAGMSTEQIDGFIEMMWDYDLSIDGVTHKVSEWASLLSADKLREQMAMTIEQKRKLQKEAESTPTILEDINNIRESLPFLLPKQQEDVQKAERQFYNESHSDAKHGHGKGYMFTNGTGTGKTYTGLGIVKRFLKQGKGRILIVTASEQKINDWIKDAKNLGINATMLPNTKSKGTGVVVTQYANIRQNRALLEDEFDLIVYDESHKIMENQDGSPTSTSFAHHMLSNRDIRQGARRILMAGEFGKKLYEAREEYDLLTQASELPTSEWTPEIKAAYTKAGGTNDAVDNRIKEIKELVEKSEEKLEEEVDKLLSDSDKKKSIEEAVKKTKVVFLSATPFNTPANLDYAENYVFSYDNTDEVTKESVRLSKRDSFLMENFGTSHVRSNKTRSVTRIPQERISDPMKASEEEVAFSDMMQNELETMSGRDLDSEYDYSREFPKLDFPIAPVFNDAIQSLSDGRFKPLREFFDHLLDDYNTQTAYLEIFKAQMIAPRIREYIDLGKKVTLYHRRKATNASLEPPFALAMRKARQKAGEDPKLANAIDVFERTFTTLFEWEQGIDYKFPQESILMEFMTQQEKDAHKRALKLWEDENGEKVRKLNSDILNLNLMLDVAARASNNAMMKDLLSKIKKKKAELDKIISKRPKPKCAMVGVFNGSETQKDRSIAVEKFNDDNSNEKILVAQVQSAKEGISLHDTTGKFPRVQIGIFLPQSPIEFIQTEGRVFRVGNKSNAIFEYPMLGLDIELSSFALKINGRSETTENLALGSRGRGLKESISRAALASRSISPKDAKGIGGKELDNRKAQQADDFDAAMKNYAEWRNNPKPSDINEIEIPDPIGYIMSMLARSKNGERVLVPNARRGSIARYIPGKSRLTVIEERNSEFARLTALVGGSGRKVLNYSFADHSSVNKYDVVVLNTGHGDLTEKDRMSYSFMTAPSRDATDVMKACRHIEDSGRVVAIVDSSKVNDVKMTALNENCVMVSEVKLPGFVMGGTPCSIVVFDKIVNKNKRNSIGSPSVVDLSNSTTEDDLFGKIRNVVAPERHIDVAGIIGRKLRAVVTPFENTGSVAKERNYGTGKMEPRIYISDDQIYVKFNNNKMVWFSSDGKVYRSFVVNFGAIAKGDSYEIRKIAEDWVHLNEHMKLSDEELGKKYRRYCYNSDVNNVRDCLRVMMQTIEIALGKTPMQINNLAQGKVENEVSGTYDLAGFREVFDSLNSGNAELEALADKVFEAVSHIEGLKFAAMPGNTFRGSAGHNVAAHYVPSRNVIELNADFFNSIRYKDGFKAQTTVHEMIHALTCWALDAYDDPSRRNLLTPEQQEACKIIKDVYAQINNDDFRRQLRLNSNIEDNAEYGLTNEEEMMAELANPVFRAALKAKKLWKQLVNGVKMMLGIQIPGTEAEETNALEALDHALETLMDSFNPDLYKAYTRVSNSETRNMEVPDKLNDSEENINNKFKDESTQELFLSLQEKEGEDYNEAVEEIARRTDEGLSSLYGQGEEDWRGRETQVSRVAEVIAADTGRRSGATSLLSPPGTEVQRATQDRIQLYAESRGIWFDEKKIASENDYITEEGESIVYRSKDGKTAVKMTYPYNAFNSGMLDFLRNTSLFNNIFPGTSYEIIGFGRDKNGVFRVIMRQPWVEGKVYEEVSFYQEGVENKVNDFFRNRGMEPIPTISYAYGKETDSNIEVHDVHSENVVVDKDGNVHIIDANVQMNWRLLSDVYGTEDLTYKETGNVHDRERETRERSKRVASRERRYSKDEERQDGNVSENRQQEAQTNSQKLRIANHIDKLTEKLGTKSRTTVYHSLDEVPEDVRKDIDDAHKQGKKVRGWYEDGQIYLFLPDIESEYQAEKTIWHETVAHHGLRELIGAENYDKLLKRLWLEHRDGEMGEWVSKGMVKNGWSLSEAIDEYLAREAEKNPFKEPGLWQRLRWMVAEVLHEIGFKNDPTISDIKYLFWVSQNQLRKNDPMGIIKQQAFLHNLEKQAANTPYVNMNAATPEDIENPNAEGAYDDGVRHSEETDEEVIERLENGPKETRYRAMVEIDGKLYPPMSVINGGKLREPTKEGVWEKSDETPIEFTEEQLKTMDALDKSNKKGYVTIIPGKVRYYKGGKTPYDPKTGKGSKGVLQFRLQKDNGDDVWAAYNPYFHTSTSGLNDQFASAWNRPNLVVVEVEIPASELTDGYQAQYAKDKVGNTPWKSGTVNLKLPKDRQRTVTLSRWAKVKGKVEDAKVAKMIAKQLEGTGLEIPFNVVTPSLREELIKNGVTIGEPENSNAGNAAIPAYEEWSGKKVERSGRRYDMDIEDPMEYSAKKVYEERLHRVETVFSEAYQDSMVALKTAQNAIVGDKDILDSQNAYMAENLMHGKVKNEQDMFNRECRDPLINTINKIMNLTGMSWGDIDRYVYTKSGLERNREFFVRDWLELQRKVVIKKFEELNDEEQDIFMDIENSIITRFEDGDITEEERDKLLAKALQEAHNRYIDEIENRWNRLKRENYDSLKDGEIDFADYLSGLNEFIWENIDEEYEPSEHDYSGFRAMFGDKDGKYNEDDIIDELMNTEGAINADDSILDSTTNTLWEQINKATRYGLERYREAGMRSDEQIDRVERMFNFYVPMRGFKEETGEDMYQYFTGKDKAKSYVGGLLKHAKGRGSEANFPISTIFAMSYKAIYDCNQNMVCQKFYRLCQNNPNNLVILSDSWAVYNDVEDRWEEDAPKIPEEASEEEVREITLAWEERMKELAKEDKARKIKGKEHFDYKPIDERNKNEHIVDVRINGQPRKMIVTGHPRMAQALNGQLRFEHGRNVFSRWNAAIKNLMAAVFTSYSPTFAMRNMFRDWTHFRMMLGVREGHGYASQANKYYRQSIFKMVGLFKKYRNGTLDESNEIERDFKDFMDNGGITGFVFMKKIDDIQKEMKSITKKQKKNKAIRLNDNMWEKILGAIEALNEGIENNARFATYRASRHYAGRTKARSAYDAKEITVNFNRKGAGSKTAGFKSSQTRKVGGIEFKDVEDAAKVFGVSSQIFGEGRIFFNATIQAIATTFRNFQNPDGSLNKPYIAKWTAKYAFPPFMFGLMLPFINKVLAAALGGGDDDDDKEGKFDPYSNLPEWTRRKNICIYIGNNNFIKIPIGQELSAFLSLGDILAGNTYAPDLKPVDRDFKDEMIDVFNTFSPVDVSTKITKGGIMEDPLDEVVGRTFSVLAPLVSVEQNLGWTGRPIYREDVYPADEYNPEYQMVYQNTNPVLVSASKIANDWSGGDEVVRGRIQVNPAIVQYMWEQYTGGPGKVLSNTVSIGKDVKDILSGNDNDFNLRKIEGLKAFVEQGDERTAFYRSQSKYRKYLSDAKRLKDAVKGYEKLAEKDPTAILKLEELTKGEDFVRMEIILEAENQLREINKAANLSEGKERKELRKVYNKQVEKIVNMLDSIGE